MSNTTAIDALKAKYQHISEAILKMDNDLGMIGINIMDQEGNLSTTNNEKKNEAIQNLKKEQEIILGSINTEKKNLINDNKILNEYESMGKNATALEKKVQNFFNESRNSMKKDFNTNRRQIQINQYNYAKRKNTIYILKLFLVTTVLSIILALIHKNTDIISAQFTKSIILGFFLVLLLAFIYNWYNTRNMNKFYWEVHNFDDKTKRTCALGDQGNYSGCIGDETYDISIDDETKPKIIRKKIKELKKMRLHGFDSIQEINKDIKDAYEIENKAYNHRIEKDRKELIKKQNKADKMEKELIKNIMAKQKYQDPQVWEEKCVKVYD